MMMLECNTVNLKKAVTIIIMESHVTIFINEIAVTFPERGDPKRVIIGRRVRLGGINFMLTITVSTNWSAYFCELTTCLTS